MPKERVAVYFDGFNLYHAIEDLHQPYLKWVNLWGLSRHLIKEKQQMIVRVIYCSAYATHFTNTVHHDKLTRHKSYCAALESKNVKCCMGKFAKRDLRYAGTRYKAIWRRREEKQTDVRIAISILEDAYDNLYDAAYIVSGDSDLVPCFESVRNRYPHKRLITVAPPSRKHNDELLALAHENVSIKASQLEKSLFGAVVRKNGVIISRRPAIYKPPKRASP